MKRKPVGVCKLCLKTKELRQSHIIPKFAFNTLYPESGPRQAIKIKTEPEPDMYRSNMQDGYKEYLLCGDCEGQLSVYENYVARLLRTRLQPVSSKQFRVEEGINYKLFRLFTLSVLWRISIAGDLNFHINLGPHSEQLRQKLLKENPGQPYQYGCALALIYAHGNSTASTDYIHIEDPYMSDGQQWVRIWFAGFAWIYRLSQLRFSPKIEPIFLNKRGDLPIAQGEISQIPALMSKAIALGEAGKFSDALPFKKQ